MSSITCASFASATSPASAERAEAGGARRSYFGSLSVSFAMEGTPSVSHFGAGVPRR